MRLLLVEDERWFIEAIGSEIEKIVGQAITSARSRDSALDALRSHTYDVIVLDQRIPSTDESFDEAEAHGRYVFAEARKIARGTPIRFLTAFGMDDFVQDLLVNSEQCDCWGTRELEPLVQKFDKERADLFLDDIRRIAAEIGEINSIELNIAGNNIEEFDWLPRRIMRIYARTVGGRSIHVRPLSGGLSGIRVFMATIKDVTNAVRAVVATKIGPLDEIHEELKRYDPEVMRLVAGNYAPLVKVVDHGAGDHGGLFYQLFEGGENNFFHLVSRDEQLAGSVVDRLETIEMPWRRGLGTTGKRFKDITECVGLVEGFSAMIERHRVVKTVEENEQAKSALEWLLAQDWERIKNREVVVRWATQHGDLHGGNVLIDGNANPTMIDFGQVVAAPACLDAITLELSLTFHPQGAEMTGGRIDNEVAPLWPDSGRYLARCFAPRVVSRCRAWGEEAGGGRRAFLATAAAYLMKQMKYGDTDKATIVQILRVIVEEFEGSFE